MLERQPARNRQGGVGWYVSFALIAIVAFVGIGAATGQDALAAAARIFWNAFAFLINGLIRVFGSLLGLIAKGVGWRRLTRVANTICGIGLGYAASVVLSEEKVRRARGWRGKLRAAIASIRDRWQALHLFWKLVIVAALIASQIYSTPCSFFPDRFPRPGRAAALGAVGRFVLRGMVLEEIRCKAPKDGSMAPDLARDTQHHRLGAPDTNSIPHRLAALEIPPALSRPRHR